MGARAAGGELAQWPQLCGPQVTAAVDEVLAPGSRSETPPSVAGRLIFLRNDEEVVAVAVKG